ncbi:MAG: hypothetical protein ACYC3I_00495 [Gemmataceae bacterium]
MLHEEERQEIASIPHLDYRVFRAVLHFVLRESAANGRPPQATERSRGGGAAQALAQANDADAIPVLIDLLLDLPAEERRTVEEFLTNMAGEWAPVEELASEDRIARKIRRDAWMVWWRNTDGPALLAVVRDHTLKPEQREPSRSLPAAAPRLLALRKPEGAVEALLAY